MYAAVSTARISWTHLQEDWNAIEANTKICYVRIAYRTGPDTAVAQEEVINTFPLIGETHVVEYDGWSPGSVTREHYTKKQKRDNVQKRDAKYEGHLL